MTQPMTPKKRPTPTSTMVVIIACVGIIALTIAVTTMVVTGHENAAVISGMGISNFILGIIAAIFGLQSQPEGQGVSYYGHSDSSLPTLVNRIKDES